MSVLWKTEGCKQRKKEGKETTLKSSTTKEDIHWSVSCELCSLFYLSSCLCKETTDVDPGVYALLPLFALFSRGPSSLISQCVYPYFSSSTFHLLSISFSFGPSFILFTLFFAFSLRLSILILFTLSSLSFLVFLSPSSSISSSISLLRLFLLQLTPSRNVILHVRLQLLLASKKMRRGK